MLEMGLGTRPFPRPRGLVLENRLCGGEVEERRTSEVLGRADRFRGCVDPSS